MKALVYLKPGETALMEVPSPVIQEPTDAIVRMVKTTICGTDLHILKGDVPEVAGGRTLGHEGVAIVEETGPAVTAFKRGDRVIVSCITSCGLCTYCRRGMYSHCTTGGWLLGHLINGTQAERVRIPHANGSLHHAPACGQDDLMVLLSDVLPTGFECGVLNGAIQPGDTVAIVGAGPIGLSALLTAQFYSPGAVIVIDTDDQRLELAHRLGASEVIDNQSGQAAAEVMRYTNDIGVDVAIEAVGVPATFELCQQIIAPGGRIANVGVHGRSAAFHLERLWSQNITVRTRLVDTTSIPLLLNMMQRGRLGAGSLVTHHFAFDEILEAYRTFANAVTSGAMKVTVKMDMPTASASEQSVAQAVEAVLQPSV